MAIWLPVGHVTQVSPRVTGHRGASSSLSPQVVGSQARILYSDQKGRVAIAVAFNQAIASGKIKVTCPVLLVGGLP